MNLRNKVDIGLGRRVQTFLSTYWGEISPHLGTALPALESFSAKLDAAITEVEASSEDRGLGVQKTVVRTRRYLRKVLFKYHLRALHRISQLIEEDIPGRGPVIAMPPDSENEEVLLTAATSAIKSVQHDKAVFEQYGMPSDAIDRMQELVTSIRNAISSRDQVVTVRVRANAGVQSSARKVKRIVKCIAPMINPVFDALPERGPSLRKAWELASRRHQLGATGEPEVSGNPPTTGTTPTTPTTGGTS